MPISLFKISRLLAVASAAFFIACTAQAQNIGTVTNHAVAVGKGAGKQGLTSIGPCLNGYLIVFAGVSADPACGQVDVSIGATGTLAVGNGGTGQTTLLAALQSFGLEVPNLTHKAVPVGGDKIGFYDVAGTAYKYSTLSELLGSVVSGVSLLNSLSGSLTWSVTSQRITATGTQTYTPHAGFLYGEYVLCAGGGAGGGAANAGANQNAAGGGGGAGECISGTVTATTIGVSKSVIIGTGGTAGTAGNNPGNAGVDSCITTTSCVSGQIVVAKAGSGGGGAATGANGSGGAGGVAGTVQSTDMPAATGQSGFPGNVGSGANTSFATTGAGGSSPYGGGGISVSFASGGGAGQAGQGFASGGAGASSSNGAGAFAGGVGAQGFFFIKEYNLN